MQGKNDRSPLFSKLVPEVYVVVLQVFNGFIYYKIKKCALIVFPHYSSYTFCIFFQLLLFSYTTVVKTDHIKSESAPGSVNFILRVWILHFRLVVQYVPFETESLPEWARWKRERIEHNNRKCRLSFFAILYFILCHLHTHTHYSVLACLNSLSS